MSRCGSLWELYLETETETDGELFDSCFRRSIFHIQVGSAKQELPETSWRTGKYRDDINDPTSKSKTCKLPHITMLLMAAFIHVLF